MSESATLTDHEAEVFAQKCREFLEEHSSDRRSVENAKEFLAAAVKEGLGGITYPAEYGGAGLTKAHDRIWRTEKAQFPETDSEYIISHGMCLPVLNDYGTDEQKTQFLAKNISGEHMWCQMFSEPNAGSDVASLRTSAVADGDEWILNGQKVWTTLAHMSDYGIIIARTNPEVVKHAGISMFIVDMKAPGVDIRPIHQIDGGSHFNEVFFTDVRIPKDWLLGELNNGWNQATAMLMYERVAIGTAGAGDFDRPYFEMLVDKADSAGKQSDPVVRDQLAEIYAMETTKSLVAMRTRDELKAGKTPGPGGSLGKLYGSVISRRVREIAQNISGPSSIAWEPEDESGGNLSRRVLNSFQDGIAGGTDEIQRNIVGDRVLGLPRDIAVDKGVPFNQLIGSDRSSSQGGKDESRG